MGYLKTTLRLEISGKKCAIKAQRILKLLIR